MCICLVGCGRGGPPAGPARPNLLLITVDSLRADRLGFAGYTQAHTPVFDALAGGGTVFTRALTPVPEATPALASLMTGRYPAAHGVHNGGSGALAPDAVTLAELLKSHGYKTGAFAASLLLHPKYGLDQGFDVYAASFGDAPRPSQVPEGGIPAGSVTDRAIEFLETSRDKPFFLWINYFDPHYFYSPPEPFASRFASNPYDGEVAYVDREAGRLMAKLREYKIDQDTIIVLAGSNGEGLGDHGEDYHGSTLQEATTRVPLVITGQGFAAGARLDAPASLVDLLPTLAQMLGVAPPEGVEGTSLLGLPDPMRPLYLEAWMPAREFGWAPLTGVVAGSLKYVSGARGELYDVAADPNEISELAEVRPADRDRLADLVRNYAGRASATRSLDESLHTQIRALGYSPDPQERSAKDPRDMVAVANDALKADRTARRHQLQAAAFLFEGVLRKDPDNYIGLVDSALMAGTRKDLAGKQRLLEKAQSLYPGDAEVYHELGHLTLSLQGVKGARRAKALFEIATALDPTNEEALYDLACSLALEGQNDPALDALEKAVGQGFRDFEWMSADTDLDGLRAEARFDTITGGKAKKREKPAPAPPAPAASQPGL